MPIVHVKPCTLKLQIKNIMVSYTGVFSPKFTIENVKCTQKKKKTSIMDLHVSITHFDINQLLLHVILMPWINLKQIPDITEVFFKELNVS